MKPDEVVILGIPFSITYYEKASDVGLDGRTVVAGSIDYWTNSIKIHDDGQPLEDIWQTLWHEIIHGIVKLLHISSLQDAEDNVIHDDIDILALALSDLLFRNEWIKDKP
jgi:hypothetical protein